MVKRTAKDAEAEVPQEENKRPRRAASQSKAAPEPVPEKPAKKAEKAAAKEEKEAKVVKVGGKELKVTKMTAAEVKAAGAKAAGGEGGGGGRVVKFGDAELELPAAWVPALGGELDKPYFKTLQSFLEAEVKGNTAIFPPIPQAFSALQYCPLDNVKVVIIGQDPYHGPRQAHGLSFSVLPPTPPPPSLKNMFKELEQDPNVAFSMPKHGNLEGWAKQGVLLLNAVLTVQQAKPNSHKGKGWEKFTDAVVQAVNKEASGVVWILWGADAKKRGDKLDRSKHKILDGPHPSPLSAHKGFFGCKHFSLCNEYLKANGKEPIDWQI